MATTYKTEQAAIDAAHAQNMDDAHFEVVKKRKRYIIVTNEAPAADEPDDNESQVGDLVLEDGRVLRETLIPGEFMVVGTDEVLTEEQVNAILTADPEGPNEEEIEVPNTLTANRGESTVEKPVAYVHRRVGEIKAANPDVRRKDLVNTLVGEGVAFYTARTQVQVALSRMKTAGASAPAPTPEPVRTETDEATGEEVTVIDGSVLIEDAPRTEEN